MEDYVYECDSMGVHETLQENICYLHPLKMLTPFID